MGNLLKTSVALDSSVVKSLQEHYSTLSVSEIVRLSVEYTLSRLPEVKLSRTMFVDRDQPQDDRQTSDVPPLNIPIQQESVEK